MHPSKDPVIKTTSPDRTGTDTSRKVSENKEFEQDKIDSLKNSKEKPRSKRNGKND
ncbi:MAG: hypothetical protein IPM34_12675 [Saprospiraceae bacterium]|nr:hypothetical protein [Saprospiraceae bacterium]